MEINRDMSDLFEQAHKSGSCLLAIAGLLESTLRTSGELRHISNGVPILISDQAEAIEECLDELRKEVDRIKASKFELSDLHGIAAMFGVSVRLVENIVTAAVGVRVQAVKPADREQAHAAS